MDEKLISEGKCLYCEQMFTKRGIGKHLAKHLSEMEKTNADNNVQTYYHLAVESYDMFLHLLVNGNAKMKAIDKYLRDIWLECCGHLSRFGDKYSDIAMSKKVSDVFVPQMKIEHEYDFGSTTKSLLKCINEYQLNLKERIILLSRNEPLKIMCVTCKKEPAVYFCERCNWDKDSYFCEPCSKIHEKECKDFADYSCMPVVNSPRMGVCGYEGGSIDLERDGAYRGK